MVNYTHLHYFWAVAREGGIARASERLHLTPQTISGQLSLLEEYLGVRVCSPGSDATWSCAKPGAWS